MRDLYFLKLGGSLITDKSASETIRIEVIKRIAGEIREALDLHSDLLLLLGHGSGSFGHRAALLRVRSRSFAEAALFLLFPVFASFPFLPS